MSVPLQSGNSTAFPFYADPMFWVQAAGVVATTAVAVVAVWLEIQRRASARYADARERFIVPCLENVRTLHRVSQPTSNVFRPSLGIQAGLLASHLEKDGHTAYKVPAELVTDLSYACAVARDVAGLLYRLEQRQNRILDDVGSMLVGDWPNPVKRSHPHVEIMHGNQAVASWDQTLLEVWIKRTRILDVASFVHDDPPAGLVLTVRVRHGQEQVYSGSRPEKLEQLLFERMKQEADLERLPERMDELRLVAEKATKDLVALSRSHAKRALR